MLILNRSGPAIAHMEVARDGEQKGPEPRVFAHLRRALHHAEPGFLEQILRDIAPAAQAGQEVEEPGVERGIDRVKRLAVAGPEPGDEVELRLPLHACHNA